MQAYRRTRWQQPARQEAIPVPEPRTGEVRERHRRCGRDRSDLHGMDRPEGQLPFGPPFASDDERTGRGSSLRARHERRTRGRGMTGLHG